jgi:type II secretory pathway component PulM
MMAQLGAWWRQRTRRERLMLQGLGVLAFAILAPLWAYQSAAAYRDGAGADLAEARVIKAQVGELAGDEAGSLNSDGSVRGVALAAAESLGLNVERVEVLAQNRLRITFAPANSVRVYRWLDLIVRHGLHVSRTSIVRVEGGEEVRGEFELAPSA